MKLITRPARSIIHSGRRSHRHVQVVIQAPEALASSERPPVNVAFVLDRSGSMGGGKFRLACRAVEQAVERLTPRERLTLVLYDHQVELVHASEAATPTARRAVLDKLARYGPRGSTNLGEGWLVGCGQVAERLSEDAVGRCMLLTDGLANVGITEPEALAHHAAELRARNVSTSTFGVGNDFDEHLLGGMADSGGGAFYYIEDPEGIPAIMDRELGETLEVVARKVVLEVQLAPGMSVKAIGPYEVETGRESARVLLPDLVSGQQLELPLRLGFSRGDEGERVTVRFRLLDREGALGGLHSELSFRYADGATNRAQKRDLQVDQLVAERYAARAFKDANKLNRDGDFKLAARALQSVARRIRSYADSDAQLGQLAQQLEQEGEAYQAPVSVAKRKADYYRSSTQAQSRSVSGERRRWKS